MNRTVHTFPDTEALSQRAARDIAGRLTEAVAARGRALVALAGGSTPRGTYHQLATEHVDAVPWSSVHVFWGDERCVPGDHIKSNQRMARETLLDHVPVPEANVHPIPGELGPDKAAEVAERELRTVLGVPGTALPDTVFDLVLLGMGGDGHTASLFPGDDALDVDDRLLAPATAPPSADVSERVTITYPAIRRSRRAALLVAGASKRDALTTTLDDPDAAGGTYPVARVDAREGVVWYVDADALGRS